MSIRCLPVNGGYYSLCYNLTKTSLPMHSKTTWITMRKTVSTRPKWAKNPLLLLLHFGARRTGDPNQTYFENKQRTNSLPTDIYSQDIIDVVHHWAKNTAHGHTRWINTRSMLSNSINLIFPPLRSRSQWNNLAKINLATTATTYIEIGFREATDQKHWPAWLELWDMLISRLPT